MGKYTGKKYCPSNATSGTVFMKKFCLNCVHENKHKSCEILDKAMEFDRDDKNFPTQWQYDLMDQPICIEFKSHN